MNEQQNYRAYFSLIIIIVLVFLLDNKNSAIAEMARLFLVNLDHGCSRKHHPNTVDFYGTTTK